MTHAAQFALAHGAALLFAWILLQQAGVPIPSAPLLIAVGSLASYGRLRLVPSLVAALTACLLADGFWYRVGRREWSKSHRFCRQKSDWKNRVLSLIWRHSGAAMLLAKFVVGSNMVSLLAGQVGLSAARFLIYDSISSLTWSGSYIALGYLLHGQLHRTLTQTLRPLLVVRAAVFLARLWRRRSLAHADAGGGNGVLLSGAPYQPTQRWSTSGDRFYFLTAGNEGSNLSCRKRNEMTILCNQS